MVGKVASRLTPEEFYSLPDRNEQRELVRGLVIEEPPSGFEHGMVASRIVFALEQYVREAGGAGVVVTCDTWFELTKLPATVRGPDVAYVTTERYRALADIRKAAPGAPDLAVEVRSPGQGARAMKEKVDDYLAADGQEVWVVEPQTRIIGVFRPGRPSVTLTAGDVLTSPQLLPGFAAVVAELLAPPV